MARCFALQGSSRTQNRGVPSSASRPIGPPVFREETCHEHTRTPRAQLINRSRQRVPPAQPDPGHDRRPGIRRPRLHRQSVDTDAQPRQLLRGVYAPPGLPRLPAVHADTRGYHDRTQPPAQRRLGHLLGPLDPAQGRGDHGRCLRAERLPHRHVRQVAPRRQLPLPATGPRLSDRRGAQGWRRRTNP